MTDAEYEAAKERVMAACTYWRDALGLAWWRLTYVWKRDEPPASAEFLGWELAGSVRPRWEYREAEITWHLQAMAELSEERLHEIVRHEFAHVLIAQHQDWHPTHGRKHGEAVAQGLAEAFGYLQEQVQADMPSYLLRCNG